MIRGVPARMTLARDAPLFVCYSFYNVRIMKREAGDAG